jgi:periplasmic divalent cation tolerance protein
MRPGSAWSRPTWRPGSGSSVLESAVQGADAVLSGLGPCSAADAGITAPGRRLVTDRLCASAHNFQPIRTIYRWLGQVHDRTEGRVALRTRCSLLPQIIQRAKHEHQYEVPSVVAVPIIDGGPDYIGWILEQTDEPA